MPDSRSIRESVAQRLQAARKQAGLSQGQVASILGVHRPTISEIEAGRRKVTAEELARLAETYGVSTEWLTNTSSQPLDPSIELAARQLSKLKKEDLNAVLDLLESLRRSKRDE